jgi:glycosyltransferase involved in cell wall biosynthesis
MITKSGVGTYIQNLLTIFDRSNEDILIYSLINSSDPEILNKNSKVRITKTNHHISIYSLREQIILPYYCKKLKPDLVHYPNFNLSFYSPSPFVVTIHDLIYYLYPEACPNKLGHLYAKTMLRRAARKSKLVITDSFFSKNDIVKHLGIPEEKVCVVYIGVNQKYHPIENPKRFLRKYNLPENYILYVGNHEVRKNIVGLLRAYSISKCRNDYFLVIGGKKDPRRGEIYEAIKKLSLENRVIFTDYILEEDLPAIYTAAKLFVFPSFYEGFGLPPLEAMACGTPVVCSNATSLPESVGKAAITVEPSDISGLARAMDEVLSNQVLQKELIREGIEQAKKFSWENTAKKTIEVYRKALGYFK